MVTVILVPFPTLLSKDSLPPCASAMRLQMGKPKPMPLALVVNNGTPRLSVCKVFSVIPVPVSLKVIFNVPLVSLLFIVKVPPSGMASTAFLIRLMKTRHICSVSAFTLGWSAVASTIFMFSGT